MIVIPNVQLEIESLVEWLAMYGKDSDGGVTRLLYTESWLEAQQALEQKMAEWGLKTYFDDVGNLYGRNSSNDPQAGVILTGSHVDTVKCGGRYDGAYGILAGMLALRFLKETYGTPKKHIEVVSLCEEEGSRFPLTFWGSTNVTGTAQREGLQELHDMEGISFSQAMQGAGFGSWCFADPRREDILSFVELHIEQGAILEEEQIPIGIVEQIVGQKRFTVVCIGEANHAGTTPMKGRKDALRGASQMIDRIMNAADRTGAPLVTTAGRIEVEPNVSNVIPGKAAFTLDIRHPQGEVLDTFCEEVLEICIRVAKERGLEVTVNKHLDVRPVEMSNVLIQKVETICQEGGIPHLFLASGAGHDAQVMAKQVPTCLLFVPSHRGISHSPEEFTRKEDLAAGVQVLVQLLYQLAYED